MFASNLFGKQMVVVTDFAGIEKARAAPSCPDRLALKAHRARRVVTGLAAAQVLGGDFKISECARARAPLGPACRARHRRCGSLQCCLA